MLRVAALFVMPDGPYQGIPCVDAWDEARDARTYRGDLPVVAHPPCARWGRYAEGGPSAHGRFKVGDDDGCFESALASVRRCGGVLEHPEASKAWRWFGLTPPPKVGGWYSAGDGGWTCCVEQGHYGHPARKATWLYAFGVERDELPELRWGSSGPRMRLDQGFHSKAEREACAVRVKHRRLTKRECLATPTEFRDALLEIALLV